MTNSNDEKRAAEAPKSNPVGRAILEGRRLVTYLWQSPHDAATRAQLRQVLAVIRYDYTEHAGRKIQGICQEMLVALRATPSPQQVDLLENGFDRLYRIWHRSVQPEKKRLTIVA